jgi:hypothetical protein
MKIHKAGGSHFEQLVLLLLVVEVGEDGDGVVGRDFVADILELLKKGVYFGFAAHQVQIVVRKHEHLLLGKGSNGWLAFRQPSMQPSLLEYFVYVLHSHLGCLMRFASFHEPSAAVNYVIGHFVMEDANLRDVHMDWVLICLVAQVEKHKAKWVVHNEAKVSLKLGIIARLLWDHRLLLWHFRELAYQIHT